MAERNSHWAKSVLKMWIPFSDGLDVQNLGAGVTPFDEYTCVRVYTKNVLYYSLYF